jgi:hypothetical protein
LTPDPTTRSDDRSAQNGSNIHLSLCNVDLPQT